MQSAVHTKKLCINDIHISERNMYWVAISTGLNSVSPKKLISSSEYQDVALFEIGSLQT